MLAIMRRRSSTFVYVLVSIRVWGERSWDMVKQPTISRISHASAGFPAAGISEEGNATRSITRTCIPSVFASSSVSILRSRYVFEPLHAQHRVSEKRRQNCTLKFDQSLKDPRLRFFCWAAKPASVPPRDPDFPIFPQSHYTPILLSTGCAILTPHPVLLPSDRVESSMLSRESTGTCVTVASYATTPTRNRARLDHRPGKPCA